LELTKLLLKVGSSEYFLSLYSVLEDELTAIADVLVLKFNTECPIASSKRLSPFVSRYKNYSLSLILDFWYARTNHGSRIGKL